MSSKIIVNMNINKVLEEFGLSKTKGMVYLATLSVGTGTAQEISVHANLPRTTTHEILNQLLVMGLVSLTTRGRTRIYTAENPQKLKNILKEKERKLDAVLPELSSLLNTTGVRPHIRFYAGLPGIKTVFADTLTCRSKVLRGILSMEDLYRVPGPEYMDWYVRERVGAGITLQVIRSEQKEIASVWPSSNEEKRELRFAPANQIFPMTVYIYDNKVALIGTQKENFGMIIESADLYQTFNNLFTVMWEVSRIAKKK